MSRAKQLLSKELFVAVREGKPVSFLADLEIQGADVNACNESKRTCLSICAQRGDVEAARFLLDKGASVDAYCDEHNSTPLMFAARFGKVEVCQLLIERRSKISLKSKDKMTALHQAAYNGRLEVCQLLLQHGADPALKDVEKETPLDQAKASGFPEIVALLEKGVQPKPADIIDLVEAESKKRRRQDDYDKTSEVETGVRERLEQELSVALERCDKAERDAAVSAASRHDVELRDRERIDTLEKELGAMLERCAKAEQDASAVPTALRQEEEKKFTEAIEREQAATQRAALAQGKLDRLEKEHKEVLDRCAKAELDAAVSAAVRQEVEVRWRERTDNLEKEIRVVLERCANAERDAAVSAALRQEDEKRFKEVIEREQTATQEALCRAVAAEKAVSELKERAARAEGKLSHVLGRNYVVKDESLMR